MAPFLRNGFNTFSAREFLGLQEVEGVHSCISHASPAAFCRCERLCEGDKG